MGTNPKETETNVSNRLLPSSVHCSTISSHYGKETIQLSVDTGDKCLKVGTLILFSQKKITKFCHLQQHRYTWNHYAKQNNPTTWIHSYVETYKSWLHEMRNRSQNTY